MLFEWLLAWLLTFKSSGPSNNVYLCLTEPSKNLIYQDGGHLAYFQPHDSILRGIHSLWDHCKTTWWYRLSSTPTLTPWGQKRPGRWTIMELQGRLEVGKRLINFFIIMILNWPNSNENFIWLVQITSGIFHRYCFNLDLVTKLFNSLSIFASRKCWQRKYLHSTKCQLMIQMYCLMFNGGKSFGIFLKP